MKLGIQEARETGNKIYLNLRIGKIAQTSKEEKEGFRAVQTENKSGTVYKFYAKPYDALVGFIKEIVWHKSEFPDGGTSQGWNITVDTGGQEYVLYIADKDRPFHRFMSALGNTDFSEPIKFVGFSGKDNGKVLLMYQDEGDFENNVKPKPVQPRWAEKWLSNQIKQKLKEKLELTEQEERSVQRDEAGKIVGLMRYDAMEDVLSDEGYPYIVQGADGKWDFTVWDKFLMAQMTDIISAVQLAADNRGDVALNDEFIGERNTEVAENSFRSDFGDHVQPDTDGIPF